MERAILVVISDTHAGHRHGLMSPNVQLMEYDEDGQPYFYAPDLHKTQEYLWDLYTSHVSEVENLADGDPIVLIHNGDLTQGHRYKQELVSTQMSNQILIAQANLKPWLALSSLKAIRLSTGTGSHVFDEGSATVLVERLLQAEYQDMDIKAVHHGLCTILGLTIDYAHHGPYTGSRKWLEGNVARYYLKDIMFKELLAGRTPPDLFLRSHFHNYVRVVEIVTANGNEYESMLVVNPSFCMLGHYARQATRSTGQISHGTVAFEIVNNKILEVHRFIQTIDIRTKEVI